jgi:hypothetical protein
MKNEINIDHLVNELEMVKRAIQNMVVNAHTGDIEYDTPMFMLDDIMNKLINPKQ